VNLYIDTCTFIWTAVDPAKLSPTAVQLIHDPQNDVSVSVASLWEIGIKMRTGKLQIPTNVLGLIQAAQLLDIDIAPIPPLAAHVIASLPPHHKDPFDRIIIATAMVSNAPVVTIDEAFDLYGITRLW
jgi:PIN domain nuclease of toxin-antitoxin system